MREQVSQDMLVLEGAELYYETRGEGPPLLVIQGGVSEAGVTEQLVTELAQHYQVVTYDRRGLSRSTATTDVPITMSRHAEDAALLLAAVTSQPARVIAPSIGALIGLHLAVEHPDRVAVLVAHEPPMSTMVYDHEQEAALDDVAKIAREDVRAAIQHMAGLSGEQPSPEEGARPGPPVGDTDQNLRWFFTHDFPAVRTSPLTGSQIRAVPDSTTILPTGGAEFPGRWEYRCAQQLADELGRTLIELPGGHNGLVSHPWSTAAELKHLLTEAQFDEA